MAASASKSTYLYFLLVNEFKHDDDYENQNMNYAEWIEEGYNKIPQVSRSNTAFPITPRIGHIIIYTRWRREYHYNYKGLHHRVQ